MGCCASRGFGGHPDSLRQPFFPFTHEPLPALKISRAVAIVNPTSGGGRGLDAALALQAALKERGVSLTLQLSERSGHSIRLAAALVDAATPRDWDCIVCVGGDGTVHEVVNGMLFSIISRGVPTRLPPIAILPCGSGNNLCLNLGVFNLADTVASILHARPYAMDIVEVHDARPGVEATRVPLLSAVADAAAVDTVAPPVTVSGVEVEEVTSGAAAVALPPAAGATREEDIVRLMRSVRFSMNCVGWALSTAVQVEAEGLRWMGCGVQYDLATYHQLVMSHTWLARFTGTAHSVLPAQHAETWAELHAVAENGRPLTVRTAKLGAPEASRAPAHVHAHPAAESSDAAAVVAGGVVCGPRTDDSFQPLMLWSAQVTAYMGSNMAYCPHARLDDGLMDVCVVTRASRLQLIGDMGRAKSGGQHVLGSDHSSAAASRAAPYVQYSQLRECVIAPADAGEAAAWAAGVDAASRSHANVCPTPMRGERSINVDGQVDMPSPARLRVWERVLPILCAPQRVPLGK